MVARSFPALSATPGFSAANLARQAWKAAFAMFEARQTRRTLAEMDGRMLADIGVDRGQARTEAARPFWDINPGR